MNESTNLENNQKNNNDFLKDNNDDYEIIIEIEIYNKEKENEMNILCDKNQLFADNKFNEYFYKANNLTSPEEFNYFNKDNTKLFLNDKEVEFDYKLKFNQIGNNKILIKSNVKLYSLATMFYKCYNIIKIKFIKINTNKVTNMRAMFYDCSKLTKLDLSLFNTKCVTDMRTMFCYCTNLTELNLSSFNTNNVTNMDGMFYNCGNLTELDLSSFNTNNVTHIGEMFDNCYNLNELDLSSFNFNNVIDMNRIFYYSIKLVLINKINLIKIKNKYAFNKVKF